MIRLATLLTCLVANTSDAADQPLWEAGLGAAAISLPDYRGADEQRGYLLPIPYFVYRGDRLKIDRTAVRGVVFEGQRLTLELSGNGTPPVNSKDNTARKDMPDLHPTIELGTVMKLRLSDDTWLGATPTLVLPIRAAYTIQRHPRSIGTLAGIKLNLDWAARAATLGWNTALQFGPGVSSQRYQHYFYGVDNTNATADRPTYRPKGGYDGLQLTWSASRRLGQTWVGAFVRADNMAGTAFDDSPLLRRRTTVSAGLGVAWVLGQSSIRVPTED
ncbi:MipA/OmpV family protein [Chitinivorax sp. B]|uniref:MipA/OmpV family protein n=1 Tax=Chitinivorax sp. B TaxID=2502235 RepID=UPI0014858388|nr:MipA/OmpV family protein [Chitinivorax sp. B]